jgi:hypothetical protein
MFLCSQEKTPNTNDSESCPAMHIHESSSIEKNFEKKSTSSRAIFMTFAVLQTNQRSWEASISKSFNVSEFQDPQKCSRYVLLGKVLLYLVEIAFV